MYTPFTQRRGVSRFGSGPFTVSSATLAGTSQLPNSSLTPTAPRDDSVEIRRRLTTTNNVATPPRNGPISQVTRYSSVEAATAELIEIVTEIKSLTEKYQNGLLPSSTKAATENEIMALADQFNQLVGRPASYTADDTRVFVRQSAILSSLSSQMSGERDQTSLSLAPLSSSLALITSSLSSLSSSLTSLSSLSGNVSYLQGYLSTASSLSASYTYQSDSLTPQIAALGSSLNEKIDSYNGAAEYLSSTYAPSSSYSYYSAPEASFLVVDYEPVTTWESSLVSSYQGSSDLFYTVSSEYQDSSWSVTSGEWVYFQNVSSWEESSTEYYGQSSYWQPSEVEVGSWVSTYDSSSDVIATFSSEYEDSSWVDDGMGGGEWAYFQTVSTWEESSTEYYGLSSYWDGSLVDLGSWVFTYDSSLDVINTFSSEYQDSSWSDNGMTSGDWVYVQNFSSWEESSTEYYDLTYYWESSEVLSSSSVREYWQYVPGSSWSDLIVETPEEWLNRVQYTGEYASMTSLGSDVAGISDQLASLQSTAGAASLLYSSYVANREGFDNLASSISATSSLLNDRIGAYAAAAANVSSAHLLSSWENVYSTSDSSWEVYLYSDSSWWESGMVSVPGSSWLATYTSSSMFTDSSWMDDGMGGGSYAYFDNYTSWEDSSWVYSYGDSSWSSWEVSGSSYIGNTWSSSLGSTVYEWVVETSSQWLERVQYTAEYASMTTLGSEVDSLTSQLAGDISARDYYAATNLAAFQMGSILAQESSIIQIQNSLSTLYASSSAMNGAATVSSSLLDQYASLSSRSSSLARQLASMSSGMLYVSSEAQRLEAALSSAMSEVSSSWSSSSSSGGESAGTSDLSDFDISNGIKIDLSTNGLIAVTREIANNRLAELAGAQERIAIAARGVQSVQQVTARVTTVLDTMSRLREQRPTTTEITNFSQAFPRRGGITPNLDLGSMTSYRPQTLLGGIQPLIGTTKRRY